MQRVKTNRERKREAAAKHNAEYERKKSEPVVAIRYSAELDRLYAVVAANSEPCFEKWLEGMVRNP